VDADEEAKAAESTRVRPETKSAGKPPFAVALIVFRVLTVVVCAAAAVAGMTLFDWPTELCVALFVMAAYVAVETGVLVGWASGSEFQASATEGAPYKEIVKVTITTQGVVLGLIAFKEGALPNATVKVGAGALVGGILVAGALLQNVAFGEPDGEGARFTASLLFSLTYWALGFGLLCVVAGSW
jgi:hypothetical protein